MFIRDRRSFLFLCTCSLSIAIWLNGFSASLSLARLVRGDSWAIAQSVQSQATDVSQLVQTGIERYSAGLFLDATELWKAAYDLYEVSQDSLALAVVSENLARAYQQLGQPSAEVIYWEKAVTATKSAEPSPKIKANKVGRLLTEQAQAYSKLGQHRRAIAILCGDEGSFCTEGSALRMAEVLEDTAAQIAALGSLGEAYRLSGDTSRARVYLEQGLSLSRQNETVLEGALLNGLGNTAAAEASVSYRRAGEASASGAVEATVLQAQANEENDRAIAYFQQSYEWALVTQDSAAQLRSQLAQVPLQERAGRFATAEQSRVRASSIISQLPDSQMKAFALLKLVDLLVANSLEEGATKEDAIEALLKPAVEAEVTQMLNQVIAIGEAIDNSRVISFALGKLGRLDERAGRYEAAIRRTQAARLAADQGIAARDSLYLWDWQMGRILKAQGNVNAAIQAYAQAVSLLEQIRDERLGTSQDLQFDFRDTVEPVYRQYAALNLRSVPNDTTLQMGADAFTALDNTLVTLDSLRVAELQSYFANDCVIAPVTTRVDAVGDSRATAVISTAILDDRNFEGSSQIRPEQQESEQLVVIVSLPDGRKRVAQVLASRQAVEATVIQFRENLELGSRDYIADYDQAPGKQLYQWLIQPFEQDFSSVKTLVFVNDGLLRSVPMAALYDGEQYLIEKFAVATTPSLTLTAPKRVERPTRLSALLMGVSDRSQVPARPFAPLPAVDSELAAVAKVLPNSKILLNQEFSLAALRKTLDDKDYRILHMATHGTFGFDPKDNFVVMGAKQDSANEFNEVLTIGELDALLQDINDPTRAPVELLTLTACETARGDTRATLGLAGVAVRAGVRSAIATLWSVGDASSAQLIADFYSNLQTPDLTKAEALQKAQIAMIRSADGVNEHPYRWAPFVLIGNWL